MKIVIDIPEEFENHFNSDRFEDSLARVASDIESFGFVLAGRYEQETITMLRKALKNAIPLPKGHGDLIDRKEIDWISIDENVPINGQRVLVCFDDGFILIGAYMDYADDGKESFWVFDGEEDFNLEDAQVIAWMPLPEPYNAESEVEE